MAATQPPTPPRDDDAPETDGALVKARSETTSAHIALDIESLASVEAEFRLAEADARYRALKARRAALAREAAAERQAVAAAVAAAEPPASLKKDLEAFVKAAAKLGLVAVDAGSPYNRDDPPKIAADRDDRTVVFAVHLALRGAVARTEDLDAETLGRLDRAERLEAEHRALDEAEGEAVRASRDLPGALRKARVHLVADRLGEVGLEDHLKKIRARLGKDHDRHAATLAALTAGSALDEPLALPSPEEIDGRDAG